MADDTLRSDEQARYVESPSRVYGPALPGGDWRTLEAFGPSFMRVPNISLLTRITPELFQDGFEADVATERNAPAAVEPAALPARLQPVSLREVFSGQRTR